MSAKALHRYFFMGKHQGRFLTGEVPAASHQMAKIKLWLRDIHCIACIRVPGKILKPLTLKESYELLLHLSELLQTGLPLLKAITLLTEEASSTRTRFLMHELLYYLEQGYSLSKGFEALNECPPIVMLFARIGEHTGQLEKALYEGALLIKQDMDYREKRRAALRYPLIILIMASLVLALMTHLLIPQFSALYAAQNVQLPLLTRWILQVSHLFSSSYFALILGLGGLITLSPIRAYLYRRWIRLRKHQTLWLTLWAKLLGQLLEAGLTLPEALSELEALLAPWPTPPVEPFIKRGCSLSVALALYRYPKMLLTYTALGETSGRQSEYLHHCADYFSARYRAKRERFQTYFPMFVLLSLGILIGTLILGLYIPIFKLGNVI